MNENYEIIIENDISEITTLSEKVEELAELMNLNPTVVFNIQLALEELLSNTISYGYDDDGKHDILITFGLNNEILNITIEDNAREFNPLLKADPDITTPLEERQIGGLGIYFVKQFMDDINYQRVDNKNIIKISKKIN